MSYAPGSKERIKLLGTISGLKAKTINILMIIDGKKVETNQQVEIHPPHEIKHLLGHYHRENASHVKMAIRAALKAKENWANMSW